MTANIIAPATEILEDGTEALIQQGADDANEEYVDLTQKQAQPDTAPAPKPEPKPVAQPVADDVPPEFKGKSATDLVKMYREAQSVIGRQGGELGELRRHADLLIKERLAIAVAKKVTEPPAPVIVPKQIEDADFFAKPKDAVAELIANHPELKALKEKAAQYEKEVIVQKALSNEATFQKEFPDAGAVLADPEFRQWIEKSNVRQRMLLSAHERYDLDAAREVFGTWKEIKGAKAAAAGNVSDAARTMAAANAAKKAAAVKAAAVPSGNNAAPKESGTKKPIFRRADVLRLMEEDPDRYESMAAEIQLAYEERRVR